MTNLPQYVENDIKILSNYEFHTDNWGNNIPKRHQLAYKLYKIGKTYPQKHLFSILEHLGYFTSTREELAEEDYREEVLHNAEYWFEEAMDNRFEMYEENEYGEPIGLNRQIKFIDIGWLDCIYTSRENYHNEYDKKSERHPSRLVYL